MGVLKDILDTIKDVKEHVKDQDFKISNMKMKSISKMSSDAILQFPVIVSKTLSIQDITMVSKALEREYASFIRIAVSMHSNETEYKNPEEFIKRFHSNMDDHYPIKDLIINVASDLSESTTFISKESQSKYRKMFNEINNSLIEPSSRLYSNSKVKNIVEQYHFEQAEINETINGNGIETIQFVKLYNYPQLIEGVYNYIKENTENGNKVYVYSNEAYIVRDTEYATRVSSLKIMKEDANIKVLTTPNIIMMKNITYDNFVASLENGNKSLLKEFVEFNYDCLNEKFKPNNYSVYHKLNEANKNEKTSDIRIRNKMPRTNTVINIDNKPSDKPRTLDLKDTLLDNDVKKSNELVPTMLAFRVHFSNNDNVVPLDFIVGIKTIAHPVSADEIIKNLSKGLKEKNTFFNFIRWTTGEIKFLKDFILNIDGIKEDVIDKNNKGSQWWSALKRRKNIAKFRTTFMMKKQILPNATIVVSTEEMTYLKNEYGIDLFDPRTVKELMGYYFLLGFVILDPSTELSYFMFDGYSGYQTFSYDALERENTNTAKEIKNIMTVLGKL